MKILLTPTAKEEMQKIAESGLYYKLDLDRDGCCSYYFKFAPAKKLESDVICQAEGFIVPVSAKVAMAARSLKIDYKRRGLSKNFTITAN